MSDITQLNTLSTEALTTGYSLQDYLIYKLYLSNGTEPSGGYASETTLQAFANDFLAYYNSFLEYSTFWGKANPVNTNRRTTSFTDTTIGGVVSLYEGFLSAPGSELFVVSNKQVVFDGTNYTILIDYSE